MPKHLPSTLQKMVEFLMRAHQKRLQRRNRLVWEIFELYRREGLDIPGPLEDFDRDFVCEHFAELTREEQRKVFNGLPVEERRELLQSLPAEERLAGLSAEQIRQYLEQLSASRPATPRKPRRKRER